MAWLMDELMPGSIARTDIVAIIATMQAIAAMMKSVLLAVSWREVRASADRSTIVANAVPQRNAVAMKLTGVVQLFQVGTVSIR